MEPELQEGEELRDIEGFEGLYKISNFGRVWSCGRITNNQYGYPKWLKIIVDKNGYTKVSLVKEKQKFAKRIHRIVAEAFIQNSENKPAVNHIDGNKANNHINNLEWVTTSENNFHAYRVLGRIGGKHMANKLGKNANHRRAIYQLNLKGDIIAHYDTIREAEQKNNTLRASNISAVLNGSRKTHGGYKWKYADK